MNELESRYPVGVQSFEELREGGYVYVDKTGYFPGLLSNKYYFLSRPRRFGKSLLLSTLEAYFRGKKELFEGLKISEYEKDWVEYPVVHIDFVSMKADDIDELSSRLSLQLEDIADTYGIIIPSERRSPDLALAYLIKELNHVTGRKVVVLIDEYDKGILETLHDAELMDRSISMLRPFFSVLKSHDRYIKFGFITGVSRFRNTTIFSGANNPYDLSMDPEYAGICGISREELEQYFGEGIDKIAGNLGCSHEKAVETLLQKYDGYRFTESEVYMCNPFSVLSAMKSGKLKNYWVMSGSSKILVEYVRRSHFSLPEITSRWVSEERLSEAYSVDNPTSLFFQTGYLTIADVMGDDIYKLRIPNQEVQSTMANLLIPMMTERSSVDTDNDQALLLEAIRNGDVDTMMGILQSIVSSVPYHEIVDKTHESHVYLSIYIIFLMLGASARCEIATSSGRVDMVAETPWRVYVFEFKLDSTPSEALAQINDRGYALQWEARGRAVAKIGVNFSTRLRTIDGWEAEA